MSPDAVLAFLQEIRWLYPGWLWSWPLSLLALAALLRAGRLAPLTRLPVWPGVGRYRHTQLPLLRRLRHDRGPSRKRGLFTRWLAYGLLLLCFHAALAQPYRQGTRLPEPPAHRDVVFILDTAVTMLLRDYLVAGERIDRITMLKSVLSHFIDRLEGNRIGLIVFSEQAYTLAPLTGDYRLLKRMVHRLEPAVLTGRTSDLGHALLYTLRHLSIAEGAPDTRPVLVLVTDVDRSRREVDPRAVAAVLQQRGYRLHTVGIGAASHEAREMGVGGLIYQPANLTLLRAIAEDGGGRFFAADSARTLEAAIQAIQTAERRPVEAEPRHLTIACYHWPLLAGLLGLLLLQLPAQLRRGG